MFTCEWLMTFFCGFFSRNGNLSIGIMDNYMIDGWNAIQRISVTLLRINEEELLKT